MIPVNMLRRARKLGIDLDEYVTKIPRMGAVVRNASGEVMSFLDTASTAAVVEDKTGCVAFVSAAAKRPGRHTCGVTPLLAVCTHSVIPVARADNGPSEAVVGGPTDERSAQVDQICWDCNQ